MFIFQRVRKKPITELEIFLNNIKYSCFFDAGSGARTRDLRMSQTPQGSIALTVLPFLATL